MPLLDLLNRTSPDPIQEVIRKLPQQRNPIQEQLRLGGAGGSFNGRLSGLPLGLLTAGALAEPTPIGEIALLALIATQIARQQQGISTQPPFQLPGLTQFPTTELQPRPMGIESVMPVQRPQGLEPTLLPQRALGIQRLQLPDTGFLKAESIETEHPAKMSEDTFNRAEAQGMGISWKNAMKLPDGTIIESSRMEHGDMIPLLEEEFDVSGDEMERGWTWVGFPKEKSYIGVPDVEKAKGNFHQAYKNKFANKI